MERKTEKTENKTSAARLRANAKWANKAYFKTLVRFPKDKEEIIRAAANGNLNNFIVTAVYEKIERIINE